jgi:hypothetical protein
MLQFELINVKYIDNCLSSSKDWLENAYYYLILQSEHKAQYYIFLWITWK